MGKFERFPDSNELSQGFVHDWEQLKVTCRSLPEGEQLFASGDVIEGLSSYDDIDGLTDMLMQVVGGYSYYREFDPRRYSINAKGHHNYEYWKDGSRHADERIRPKPYHGRLTSIQAVLFNDVRKVRRLPGNDKPRSAHYGLFADVNSSGRGVVGKVAKLVRVLDTGNLYGSGVSSVSYHDLPTSTAAAAAERLSFESISTADKLVMNGLTRIYSGGLPGHGKRRR